MNKHIVGRFIVTDPKICHGKPTFRGTRILVADVLEMVASGMDWDAISDDWDNKVTKEAIAEAVNLANQIFADHIHEYDVEPVTA